MINLAKGVKRQIQTWRKQVQNILFDKGHESGNNKPSQFNSEKTNSPIKWMNNRFEQFNKEKVQMGSELKKKCLSFS